MATTNYQGCTVNLFKDGVLFQTKTTDVSGNTSFTGLDPASSYKVEFTMSSITDYSTVKTITVTDSAYPGGNELTSQASGGTPVVATAGATSSVNLVYNKQ